MTRQDLVRDIASQVVDIRLGNQEQFNIVETIKDAAIGLAVGATLPGTKVQGVTSGKGSMQAVTNQMRKKLANETITNVTLKTSAKMAVCRQVNGALVEGSVVAPFVEKVVDNVCDSILPSPEQKCKE